MISDNRPYIPVFEDADIESLHNLIKDAEVITTISHVRPDGDAVGSSLGIYGYLESLGKDVKSIFPTAIPDNLLFLPKKENILIHNYSPEKSRKRIMTSDLIICLDFNTPDRIEEAGDSLKESPAKKVLIDHHLFPARDFFDLCFSTPEISSTAELTYFILLRMEEVAGDASNLPLSSRRALMTGMTTDTNNFANSTFPSTLIMASDLIASGVDREEILQNFLQSYKENRLRLVGVVLKDLMKITPEGVAYYIIPHSLSKAYDIKEGDTEGIVNMPLSIKRVRMSISVKEESSCFRISIRSKRGTSANMMARKYFSGGGHECAAGGKIFIGNSPSQGDVSIPDPSCIEEYVLSAIHEYFGNNFEGVEYDG